MKTTAKRVGGLCGKLVTVNPECRSNVSSAARGADGVYYDAEREAVSYSNWLTVVRSVGRIAAISLCRERVKVVFKGVPNGMWFNASDLLFGKIECHCGARFPAKGFGENTGYCAVCEACD